jgi:hypothetical protein
MQSEQVGDFTGQGHPPAERIVPDAVPPVELVESDKQFLVRHLKTISLTCERNMVWHPQI